MHKEKEVVQFKGYHRYQRAYREILAAYL